MMRAAPAGQAERGCEGSEERPVLGDYAVTTPFVICRNWSAPHGEGYALGPEPVRGPGRRGPDRSRRGGAAAQAGRSVRPDAGAGRGAGPEGEVPAGRSGDGAGLDGGGDRARATSMNDITLLAHQEPVFGAPPSDTTVRRTLELADPRTLDKIARVRAAVRGHVWSLICATPAGFPWLAVAGKVLAGWLVIDLDATLITACSDQGGAAPTFKSGYGFHPLGAWCANTAES